MTTNPMMPNHASRLTCSLIALFTAAAWTTPTAAAAADDGPGPGDKAPPISINALTNAPDDAVANWEVWSKGVVVIEFWGTWCAPCIQAIPHINELHEKFHPKGVRFLSVTFEEPDLIAWFLKRKRINTWIGHDTDKSMVDAYRVQGWPTTFVVRDGVIVARTRPTELTVERLEAIVEGKPDPGEPEEPEARAAHQVGKDGRPLVYVISSSGVDPLSMIPDEEPIFQVIVRDAGELSGSAGSGCNRVLLGMPLSSIVAGLWGVPLYEVAVDEEIATGRFDVIYRVPWAECDAYLPIVRDLISRSLDFQVETKRRKIDALAMRIADGGCKLPKGLAESGGFGINSSQGRVQVTGASMSLDSFGSVLAGYTRCAIVDETKLTGTFFVDLELPTDPEQLAEALKEKCGLVLVPIKHEIEVLVVTPRKKAEETAALQPSR